MPDLSYLDTLTNQELHQKWLEHGLPDVPVYDTNRHALIRRLRLIYQGHTVQWWPTNVVTNPNEDALAENTPRIMHFPRF